MHFQINVIQTIELSSNSTNLNESIISSSANAAKTALLIKQALAKLEVTGKKLSQLRRITLTMKEDSHAQSISSTNPYLSQFDLVAVQPHSEKLFMLCTQSSEIDLITFDASTKVPFRIKASMVRQAIDNGIMFEINFSQLIKDEHTRKIAMANMRRIVEATKGKHIVFTSGANSALNLRGTYDLTNFGTLLGMDMATSHKCLSDNPRALLLHAQARKTFRGVVAMQPISSLPSSEAWKVPESPESSLSWINVDEEGSDGDNDDAMEEDVEDSNKMELDQKPSSSSSNNGKITSIQAHSSSSNKTKSFTEERSSKGKRKRADEKSN